MLPVALPAHPTSARSLLSLHAGPAAGPTPGHTSVPCLMLGVAEAAQVGFALLSLGFEEEIATRQIQTQLNLGNISRTIP